ncbi:hypothetical protein I3842_16G019900 [Carya illinoinensis]|uniref:Uncharacterized protein n=1 Tax=Carya illinoinensis TaxID=32201 RepID=A0A922A612_CARIL|nr:hypothetical protein I3842_16G019900 [Carya illinoinensis]
MRKKRLWPRRNHVLHQRKEFPLPSLKTTLAAPQRLRHSPIHHTAERMQACSTTTIALDSTILRDDLTVGNALKLPPTCSLLLLSCFSSFSCYVT